MDPSPSKPGLISWRRWWLWLPVVPSLLLGAAALMSGGGLSEAYAPLLGPFAGVPIGHWDCTMANAMPGRSLATGVLGLASIGWLVLGSSARWSTVIGALGWAGFWASWTVLAILSLINASM